MQPTHLKNATTVPVKHPSIDGVNDETKITRRKRALFVKPFKQVDHDRMIINREKMRAKCKVSAHRRRHQENEVYCQLRNVLMTHFIPNEMKLQKSALLRITIACVRLRRLFRGK